MLKQMRTFVAGVLAGALLFGTVAYAATGISVDFLPMKFFFDGVEKSLPADQAGLVYQGRTYVPLRFVSESVGKEVSWDGATNTAYIGKKPVLAPAPVPAAKYEIYQNESDKYSLNVPKGFVFSPGLTPDKGSGVLGSTVAGDDLLIVKIDKAATDIDGTNFDAVLNLTLNMLKSNPDYKYITADKTTVNGNAAVRSTYNQTIDGKSYYVSEYYILTPGVSYDLNFITETEPNKEIQEIINEAINSFKVIQ